MSEPTDNVLSLLVDEAGQPIEQDGPQEGLPESIRETRIPVPDGIRRRAVFVFDEMLDGSLGVAMIRYGWGSVELYGLCELAKEVIREDAKGPDQDGGPDQSPYQTAAAN